MKPGPTSLQAQRGLTETTRQHVGGRGSDLTSTSDTNLSRSGKLSLSLSLSLSLPPKRNGDSVTPEQPREASGGPVPGKTQPFATVCMGLLTRFSCYSGVSPRRRRAGYCALLSCLSIVCLLLASRACTTHPARHSTPRAACRVLPGVLPFYTTIKMGMLDL